VGYKGGKTRDIDLLNSVRRPLYTYLQQADRDQDTAYVLSSRRAARFTEAGIHDDPKRVTFGGETLGWLGEVGGRVLVLGCETLSYPTTHP
jgi:hypothetical protein